MPNVRPFKGIYYNKKKVGALSNVVVPPYDVISEAQKREYIKKSPFNYVRIILGKSKTAGYAPVAKVYLQWRKKGILIQDERPRFYFWEQTFKIGRKSYTRKGIVTAVELSAFKSGTILPHEKTFAGPKEDRLKIMTACHANLSPIFMMYDDAGMPLEKKITRKSKKPFLIVKDNVGTSKLWKIEDKNLEHDIEKTLKNKKLYIIDGHHRFATAYRYSTLHKGQASRYVLSVITNMKDPAVVVYPIYRVLKRTPKFNKETYLKTLNPFFHIKKKKLVKPVKKGTWGVVFRNDAAFYELTLKKEKKSELFKGLREHESVKKLDVTILQQCVIPKKYHSDLVYVGGMKERFDLVLKKLKKGKFEAMWLVSAPSVMDLKRVSDARQIMPAKSTFFYPKVLAGAIIREL